jgi:hypothetical protein
VCCGREWVIAVVIGFQCYGSLCMQIKFIEELLHSFCPIRCICKQDLRTVNHYNSNSGCILLKSCRMLCIGYGRGEIRTSRSSYVGLTCYLTYTKSIAIDIIYIILRSKSQRRMAWCDLDFFFSSFLFLKSYVNYVRELLHSDLGCVRDRVDGT